MGDFGPSATSSWEEQADEEEDETTNESATEAVETEPETEPVEEPEAEPETEQQTTAQPETRTEDRNETRETRTEPTQETETTASDTQAAGREYPELKSLDLHRDYTPRELARALFPPEYVEEKADDPRATYLNYRGTVSDFRSRKTFTIREDFKPLTRSVRDQIEREYGERPQETDLREMALLYGLMHWEELIEMADEFGLEYA